MSYEFVFDNDLVIETQGTSVVLCNVDDGEVHTLQVRAIGATAKSDWSVNVGTFDELKEPGLLPSATPTPTPTATPTATPTPWPRPPDAICADFTGRDGVPDGVIGYADFGVFLQQYGKRNDGVKEIE